MVDRLLKFFNNLQYGVSSTPPPPPPPSSSVPTSNESSHRHGAETSSSHQQHRHRSSSPAASSTSSTASSTTGGSSSHNQIQFEPIEQSDEYQKFRSNIALKRICLDDDITKIWSIHECGGVQRGDHTKIVHCPVIFLPPVSGSADVFFRQMTYLAERGHRVISTEYPCYFTLDEFLLGFLRLIQHFRAHKVHLVGASLGGFLAQKFAQFQPQLIGSLFLCNSFGDTARFKYVNTVPLVWFAPAPILRSYFVSTDVPDTADTEIHAATHFMRNRLGSLSQTELLSRLTLNLTNDYVQPDQLQHLPVTIMDVFDHCANSTATRQELYKMYPNARRAHLKSGGNFPYLSRADEVNIHLLVHLRQFNNTELSSSVHHLEVLHPFVHQPNSSTSSSSVTIEAEEAITTVGQNITTTKTSNEEQETQTKNSAIIIDDTVQSNSGDAITTAATTTTAAGVMSEEEKKISEESSTSTLILSS